MHYLAEFYLPGGTPPEQIARRAQAGAEQAAREGADVCFLQAIFVPKDENGFALYHAASARQVSAAAAAAGLVFDRITPAVPIPGSRPPQPRAAPPRPGA